jgi:nitrogen fixation/metabolism regulation signal transduction histidine kinase
MTNKHFYRAVAYRLISLLVLSMSATYLLFVQELIFWSLLLFLAALGLALNALRYFNRVHHWIASFLLGIENEDTTLKIPDATGNKAIDEVFKGLHRLNELFRKTKIEIGAQEKYYLSIINQSATGLFSVNEQGRIININPSAEQLTGLIAFQHVNTLSRIHPSLPEFIQKGDHIAEPASAIYENAKGQKLLFKLSEIQTPTETIVLVVVSDITKELDVREVDAWIKLARTLSHEIMNNIAPITTLSKVTLKFFTKEGQSLSPEEVTGETIQKTITGLQVIEERSTGLKKFVENYRKFTKLPDPEWKKVELAEFISGILLICSGFKNYHQVKILEQLPEQIQVLTDENLLSQVLINLLKNALESFSAVEEIKDPLIQIKASPVGKFVQMDVCNNGAPIPPELREQIFVPFFTTKEKGTGIGLSLSKQIMLKLGGDILLKSEPRKLTCFRISLPLAHEVPAM